MRKISKHFSSIVCWLFAAIVLAGAVAVAFIEAPKVHYQWEIIRFLQAEFILASVATLSLFAGFILRYKPDGPIPDEAGYKASSIGFGGSGLIFALILVGIG